MINTINICQEMFKEHTMSKRTAFPEPQAPASYGNILEMRIQACTSLIQSDTLGTRPSQRLQGDLKQESRDWRQKRHMEETS